MTHRTKVKRLKRQLLLPLWKLGCDCGLLLRRIYRKVPSPSFLGSALCRAGWGAEVRISSLTKEGGCLLLLWLQPERWVKQQFCRPTGESCRSVLVPSGRSGKGAVWVVCVQQQSHLPHGVSFLLSRAAGPLNSTAKLITDLISSHLLLASVFNPES